MPSLSDKAPPTAVHAPPSTTPSTTAHSGNHRGQVQNPAGKKTQKLWFCRLCDRFGLCVQPSKCECVHKRVSGKELEGGDGLRWAS